MITHPIEKYTTDDPKNIHYAAAKRWLGEAMCWFGLWSAVCIIGLIIFVGMFVDKFDLTGFFVGAALATIGGLFALRKSSQIITCFDPFTRDKVLDSRSTIHWGRQSPKPQGRDRFDDESFQTVSQRQRADANVIDDDDLAAAVG